MGGGTEWSGEQSSLMDPQGVVDAFSINVLLFDVVGFAFLLPK